MKKLNMQVVEEGSLTNFTFFKDGYFYKCSLPFVNNFIDFSNYYYVLLFLRSKKFPNTLPIKEINHDKKYFYLKMNYYSSLIKIRSEKEINQEVLFCFSELIINLHTFSYEQERKIIKWDYKQQLLTYWNLLQKKDQKGFLNYYNLVEHYFSNYKVKKLVLSHNDLVLNNFVKFNNKWFLIDFEFSTWNDHLFDIASFASENLSKERNIKNWFSCFKLTKLEKKKLHYLMFYQNLIFACWATFCFSKTNKKEYLAIRKDKLKKLSSSFSALKIEN